MGHYQRNHRLGKKGGGGGGSCSGLVDGDEDEESRSKRAKPNLLIILFLFLFSCTIIFSLLYSFGFDGEGHPSVCSSVSNGTISCDRSGSRSDVCVMKGDVRTHPSSSSVVLYRNYDPKTHIFPLEMIKPYTRKWETSIMDTIDELRLVVTRKSDASRHQCDVQHNAPTVIFSTGGYTGNVYHEFNDGILPLYITSQHFNRKVVFVILEYHRWWISKYNDILPHLSDYRPVDFRDNRTHCFPEAIVGLRIHGDLTIDPLLMKANKSMSDFRELLDQAYLPRIRGLIQEEMENHSPSAKEEKNLNVPKLVIIARNGSREILNEDSLVRLAEKIGFQVEILRPCRTLELARIYRVLNSSDVMVGVHGAAMTHFLFMRPAGASVFIQIIPLGTDWAAETFYGAPAKKMGLRYIGYKILPDESTLYDEYDKKDPVLTDSNSMNVKGWEFTKKIYLDRQNVRLNLRRFQKSLLRAYYYTIAVKNGRSRKGKSVTFWGLILAYVHLNFLSVLNFALKILCSHHGYATFVYIIHS
ncbi:unnamed protein product [Cuscuta europaea]|uniref:Glycosyltransferase 61 catalytic domain-containing protein n=1 Tax=Cuscuta europaea TaxID=41803 RepID=A0A9P0ZIN4_CUSEU|nr:unnamed protein product [Cuscuta europaea]